jgi:release factor glutamine methyltransferase
MAGSERPPLQQTLAAGRDRLMAAGIGSRDAELDVQLFARTILGWDTARLLIERSAPTPPELEPTFSRWIARRESYEPTAYILGVREFWGLEFSVTPAVLIPRPETEMVVENGIGLCTGLPAPRLADIGTGSGCIAVSLAHSLPSARVVATDVSSEAVAVASENAVRHGVADRVDLRTASYLDGVEGAFDLIAANPPYVRDGDKPALAADVKHEPDVALFGGQSGLRNIEGVLDTAIERLVPGGWLLMEFGFGQDDDVAGLVAARPALRLDRMVDDLQGIPRIAIVQRER